VALGAALGEELESAANPEAARHWRELGPLAPCPDLPAGSQALAQLVQAPPALNRALAQIGLVGDAESGRQAQQQLAPGQALVCPAGSLWRWDGYTILPGTPTAAAVRLQQRNRLAVLRSALARAEQETAAARAEFQQAETLERGATENEQAGRAELRRAEQALERARGAHASLRSQAETAATKLASLDEQISRTRPEHDETASLLASVRKRVAELGDVGAARADVAKARAALAAARSREAACRGECEALGRLAKGRAARLAAIDGELAAWSNRAAQAAALVSDLRGREAAARAERAELEAVPARLAAESAALIEVLEAAEAAHRQQSETLAAAEREAAAASRAERAAEAALSSAREAVVRAESAAAQAALGVQAVAERITERLGAGAGLPDPPADLSAEAEQKASRRLDRLQKEREEMGPVNLRAELEAEEITKQMEVIVAEGQELTTAIAKLRGSIGHLNREGRERLSAIFQQVDMHFQGLFSRMFGGGRAHLALVGSDDPLVAGLEIYAQPPGKKLATLSLLSGGEQALTALSLIFAVFRCNPAPVCVLDEVDAPLDDANVDRFCALLEDMVRDTGTRFLVVTHHHLTMARMDRLYGVTMQERGVSRLLSVDLQRAAELVDQPRIAAE
jgi:chromosome segregation protein